MSRKVVLVKRKADGTGKPKGATYEYSYKSLRPGEALQRAHKALKRDHPAENADSWWELHDAPLPEPTA